MPNCIEKVSRTKPPSIGFNIGVASKLFASKNGFPLFAFFRLSRWDLLFESKMADSIKKSSKSCLKLSSFCCGIPKRNHSMYFNAELFPASFEPYTICNPGFPLEKSRVVSSKGPIFLNRIFANFITSSPHFWQLFESGVQVPL